MRAAADGRELLLDAAHNPAGAAALGVLPCSGWASYCSVILAAMRDKDIPQILREVCPPGRGIQYDTRVQPAIG